MQVFFAKETVKLFDNGRWPKCISIDVVEERNTLFRLKKIMKRKGMLRIKRRPPHYESVFCQRNCKFFRHKVGDPNGPKMKWGREEHIV